MLLRRINSIIWNWWRSVGYLLLLFLVIRITFHIYNNDLLIVRGSAWQFIKSYYWGFRYDFMLIVCVNLPFLFLGIVLNQVHNNKWRHKVVSSLSFTVNFFIIAVAIADIPYFRFNSRRVTREVFDLMKDSASAFSSFFVHYFGFFVFAGIATWILWLVIYKWKSSRDFFGFTLVAISCLLITMALNFGHWLTPKNITFKVPPAHSLLVLNSPYSLAYSYFKGQETLERKSYFSSKDELKKHFCHQLKFTSEEGFKEKNIVIFVLESFSQEYLIEGHKNKAPTPFLDSILKKSIVFENMYANGTTSSYGLMSILGGIPPFMDEPYFSSIYGDNQMTGIGTLLKNRGYTSSFFYGAEDDHYGFRKNMSLLGIDNYFSRKDYKGKEYDGQWGIYDEPFLQFAANKLNEQDGLKFTTIFNISSHFPYMVPLEYQDILDKGSLPSHQSTAYMDLSIQRFFERLKDEEWFSNTIFVFVADHWAKMRELEFKNDVGRYRIPFFLYDPEIQEGKVIKQITQQVDIIPTLFDYLNFQGNWMSFGESAIDTSESYQFTFNEYENIYQIIDSAFVLTYDENKEMTYSLFNYKTDPEMLNDLKTSLKNKKNGMEQQLKAVIQTYNNRLVDNELNIEP